MTPFGGALLAPHAQNKHTAMTCAYRRSYFINLSSEIIVKHMRRDLFGSMVCKNVAFFDKSKTGDLTNRLAADTTVIANTLTETVSMALRGAGSMVMGTAFMVYSSWELALVAGLTLFPLVGVTRVYGAYVGRIVAGTEAPDTRRFVHPL